MNFKTFLIRLARWFGVFAYRYAKADNTASLVLLFDGGASALTIIRGHAPFQGFHCFPGGFLNAGEEDLAQCAVRELEEETGIRLAASSLKPVDVRSAPGRDPRGHVIDHGFVYLIPSERKDEILSQLRPGDDASEASVQDVGALMRMTLAFDHAYLLRAALAACGKSVS